MRGGFLKIMTVLHMLDFNFDEIIDAVTEIRPVRGRAQILDLKTDYTVMIDFASVRERSRMLPDNRQCENSPQRRKNCKKSLEFLRRQGYSICVVSTPL